MKHHLENVKHEQFYTDPEIAKHLIKYFDKTIDLNRFKLIVEPSAGKGSFSLNLPKKIKKMAFDIDPQHRSIRKQDFLTFKSGSIKVDASKVLCIGNPPFGHNSSLAKKFIKKCANFSDHIAFILPRSFRSPSYLKSVPINYHKILDVDLPSDIFIYPDHMKSKKLQTAFMYFERKDYPRRKPKTYKPNKYWSFITKANSTNIEKLADFRIVRGAGKVGKCFIKGSKGYKVRGSAYTDYYIKLTRKSATAVKHICDKIDKYNFIYHNVSDTLRTLNRHQLTRFMNSTLKKYYEK